MTGATLLLTQPHNDKHIVHMAQQISVLIIIFQFLSISASL